MPVWDTHSQGSDHSERLEPDNSSLVAHTGRTGKRLAGLSGCKTMVVSNSTPSGCQERQRKRHGGESSTHILEHRSLWVGGSTGGSEDVRASKVNEIGSKIRDSLKTYYLVGVVSHRSLRLRLLSIVHWRWVADSLLSVRRSTISWFVCENARLVNQFIVTSRSRCDVVQRRSCRIIVSVVRCGRHVCEEKGRSILLLKVLDDNRNLKS